MSLSPGRLKRYSYNYYFLLIFYQYFTNILSILYLMSLSPGRLKSYPYKYFFFIFYQYLINTLYNVFKSGRLKSFSYKYFFLYILPIINQYFIQCL